jgi:hypothetical protein
MFFGGNDVMRNGWEARSNAAIVTFCFSFCFGRMEESGFREEVYFFSVSCSGNFWRAGASYSMARAEAGLFFSIGRAELLIEPEIHVFFFRDVGN